ncbi:MAG: ATP-binding protein [Candidatus Kerfeldbacteria bacterium]|nr:ATP-binding protein [Candidatus Kerfeldbacteria bacterium]
MKVFHRDIEPRITSVLFKGKMVVILGPRQSGKTTLAKKIIATYGQEGEYYDCQLADVRAHFVIGKPDALLPLTKNKKIVVFDEAQTIQNIGTLLKVFHDTYPGVQIIATGSSSFDLANKIKEPMTGRAYEFTLLPLSLHEVISAYPDFGADDVHALMQFGSYPAVVAAESVDEKLFAIKNISTNYLYKDVFVFEAIRNPQVFENLVKVLALQVGSMVSLNELAQGLSVTRGTVNRYLKLLEQSFIIKIVHSFSNNPRTELKKAFKVFFLDTGVRNALVDIASPMEARSDKGAIFENFYVDERIKQGTLHIFPPEIFFWRTRTGVEIDVIEKNGKEISAYECKWKEQVSAPAAFSAAYPEAHFECITTKNIVDHLGQPFLEPPFMVGS